MNPSPRKLRRIDRKREKKAAKAAAAAAKDAARKQNRGRHNGARLETDHPYVAWTAVIATAVVAGVSFLISFESLTRIGVTMKLVLPQLVPIMIDGSILIATILLLVKQSRRQRAGLVLGIIWGSTAISAVVNFATHLSIGWIDEIAAAAVAALAPVYVLALTHAIADVIVPEATDGFDDGPTEAELAWAESDQVLDHVVTTPDHALTMTAHPESEDPGAVADEHHVAAPGQEVVSTPGHGRPTPDHDDHGADYGDPGSDHDDHSGSVAVPTDLLAYADLDEAGKNERRELAVDAVLAGDSISSAAKAWAVTRTSLGRWVDVVKKSC